MKKNEMKLKMMKKAMKMRKIYPKIMLSKITKICFIIISIYQPIYLSISLKVDILMTT